MENVSDLIGESLKRGNISEIEINNNLVPVSNIRKGGKQKSGKAPLKHSNFYFQINTNIPGTELQAPSTIAKIKKIVNELSIKIENEFLLMAGSDQGAKDFNLPKNITREECWLRVEGNPVVKYDKLVSPQTKLVHIVYLYAISKRGLDSQIELSKINDFLKVHGMVAKSFVFRDAKADINVYTAKNPLI